MQDKLKDIDFSKICVIPPFPYSELYHLRLPGPYTARSASDRTEDWLYWYVTNDGRTNVLSFPHGRVFTTREHAEHIAEEANKVL